MLWHATPRMVRVAAVRGRRRPLGLVRRCKNAPRGPWRAHRSYNAFLHSAQRWRAKHHSRSPSPDRRRRGAAREHQALSPPPTSLLAAFEEARLNAETSKQVVCSVCQWGVAVWGARAGRWSWSPLRPALMCAVARARPCSPFNLKTVLSV